MERPEDGFARPKRALSRITNDRGMRAAIEWHGLDAHVPPEEAPHGVKVVFGKAFLDAIVREDRDAALVFARAFLTQLPDHPR